MLLRRGNLFLVGMPGSGKSTLGRVLARNLGKTFVDADHELERRLGVSISTIFEIEGEETFRSREEETLARLVQRVDIVLATGGGAVLREPNRDRLVIGTDILHERHQWLRWDDVVRLAPPIVVGRARRD